MLAATTLLVLVLTTHVASYKVKTPPLTTDWTDSVGEHPWPEYPRPQMIRERWLNLNGIWTYRNASAGDIDSVPSGPLDHEVLIPSCLESGLSGIMAPVTPDSQVKYSWFHTTFDVPADWHEDNVVINFGAVDYEATVFVNGHKAAFHRGGYTRFSKDITKWLKSEATNSLAVFVFDPTDTDDHVIPIGKQTQDPSHIFYTPCTGIWQSVFIEPVPRIHVERVDIAGDALGGLDITVHSSAHNAEDVGISISDPSGVEVYNGKAKSDTLVHLSISDPHPWLPGSPSLYNVTVTLGKDEVITYTAFRTIERSRVNGVVSPVLNGEAIFLFGTLDQGYWPDGIYTPPSYEAMVYDLKVLKDLGFNMVRKHIKVETDLFYRSCDELGLMVIQDMPNLRLSGDIPGVIGEAPKLTKEANSEQNAEYQRQLLEMVQLHKSFPCIVSWMIINEAWGQSPTDPQEVYLTPLVKALDPTRLINSASGWYDHGVGDFIDNHNYPAPQCGIAEVSGPSSPYDPTRIGFQGEFGGLGHNVSIDHLWNVQKAIDGINGTYELDPDLETWNRRAHEILDILKDQTEHHACSGGVWTQTTDVEGEVNGLMTYDRRILRPDKHQWRQDIQALYETAKSRARNKDEGVLDQDREQVVLGARRAASIEL